MKKLLVLVLVALMVFSLAACQPAVKEDPKADEPSAPAKEEPAKETSTAEEGTFKLGFFTPLTTTNGNAAYNSIKMYVDELNAKGGLLGQQIEVFAYDDNMDSEEAVKIATRLVEMDKVDFIIASQISNCVMSTGQIIEDAQIPFFGLGFSPTFMQQGWKYCIRPTVNTGRTIPYIPKVMKEFGFESVGIFEGQDDYGASAGQTMRDACAENGITVTTTENYVSGDTDFSGQVAKILDSKPDCVFLGVLGNDAGNSIKQFRQFGYDGILFYTEPLQQDIMDVAGDSVNHVAFTFPYVTYTDINDCTDPVMYDFLEKYQTKYSELPLGEAAYRAWDAMSVLDKGVTDAGTKDGKAIIEAIYNIKDFRALGGMMDFTNRDGECLTEFATFVVVDQKSIAYDAWKQSEDYNAFAEQMGW